MTSVISNDNNVRKEAISTIVTLSSGKTLRIDFYTSLNPRMILIPNKEHFTSKMTKMLNDAKKRGWADDSDEEKAKLALQKTFDEHPEITDKYQTIKA